MMTFLHSALEADGNGIPDTSPAMIRAQCLADSLGAARELVRAKNREGARGDLAERV
jgi:hypothetical protein